MGRGLLQPRRTPCPDVRGLGRTGGVCFVSQAPPPRTWPARGQRVTTHNAGGVELRLIEPDKIELVGVDLITGERVVHGILHRSDARTIARTVLACLEGAPAPEDPQVDFGHAFVLGQDSVIAMAIGFREHTRRVEVVTEDAIRVRRLALAVLDDLIDRIAAERANNPATRLGMRRHPVERN
jgi:hypothetical protein